MIHYIVVAAASILIGAALGFAIDWLRQRNRSSETLKANETAARILEEARKESEILRKEAQVQAKDIVLNDIDDPTVANSPLVFPSLDDLAKSHKFKVFKDQAEEDEWNSIFQPIYTS